MAESVAAIRVRLGPAGMWLSEFLGAAAVRRAAQHIERLVYASLWSGEVVGSKDVFVLGAIILAATSRLTFGSGIAKLWARHLATMHGAAATLGEAWPDRFINGIGVSHAMIVDASGQHYTKPLERMRNYLRNMADAIAFMPAPAAAVPRVLAALRPKMLELAGARTLGAHPYFVPPAHTSLVRRIFGPDRLLTPEQAVLRYTDAVEARRRARAHLAVYLSLPNSTANLHEFGYGDDDLSGQGSDRLVDAIVAWGDERAIARRVSELRASGADHVLVHPQAESLAGALEHLTSALLA